MLLMCGQVNRRGQCSMPRLSKATSSSPLSVVGSEYRHILQDSQVRMELEMSVMQNIVRRDQSPSLPKVLKMKFVCKFFFSLLLKAFIIEIYPTKCLNRTHKQSLEEVQNKLVYFVTIAFHILYHSWHLWHLCIYKCVGEIF